MVSKEPIESIYSQIDLIIKNPLFNLYKSKINLNNFNYDMLYAYTQVGGITLTKRTLEAEKFAKKLSEKNLDNQTIRTILETQNIKLPQNSASFIEANNNINNDFFDKHHNLLLYVNHPNLVTIYDSNNKDGYIYVASEPLNNKISTEKLFETFTQEGKINLIIQVSRAVACLHSNKILHLNICPNNIFALVQEGGICQIKLLAAGLIPDIDSALEMGGGSEFKPVFAFMSPEYLLGKEISNIGAEEDIYALGCLLYFYLSGQRPWQNCRTLFEILEESKKGNIALSGDIFENIPENLKSVILKATDSSLTERYNNVAEFIEDLEKCRDGGVPVALTQLQEKNKADKVNNVADDIMQDSAENDVAAESEDNSASKITSASLSAISESISADVVTQKSLTEDDLPKPFTEPEIPDINNISPDLNKNSSKIWKKLFTGVIILGILGGGSYYLLSEFKNNQSNKQNNTTANMSEEEQKDKILLQNNNNDSSVAEIEAEESGLKVIAEEISSEKEHIEVEEELINEIADYDNDNKVKPESITEVVKANNAFEIDNIEDEIDIPSVTGKNEEQIIEKSPQIDQEKEKQERINKEYIVAVDNGNEAMKNKNYALAIIEYKKALELKNNTETANLLKAANIQQQYLEEFENLIKKAEEQLYNNDLASAQITVINAKNITGYSDEPRIEKIIDEIKKIQFETTLEEGNQLLLEENYQDALVKFAWALGIEGYENHPDALNGKKIAEETILKIEKKKAEEEARKRNRLAQYNAAIAEADKMLTQKRWDEAIAAYDIALNVPDYTDDTKALAGKQNALNSKLEEERLAIEKEKQRLKDQYETYIKNGNIYLNASLWVEAEKEFNKALEVEGYAQSEEAANGRKMALEQNRLKVNREQYDALLQTAMQHIAAKDYVAAEKSFRDALLIPGFDNEELARQGIMFAETLNRIITRAEKYNTYISAGKENLLNKNAVEAAKDFGRAIVEAPNQINAYILRGSAYLEAGDPDRAIGNFNQVLEIEPDFESAQIGKAIAFFKDKNYEKAFEAFSELAESTDNNIVKSESETVIGWLFLENEDEGKEDIFASDNKKAYEIFSKAGESGNNVAWNNLGYMFMYGIEVKRDYDKAVEYFQQAADSDLPEGLFNLGMAYYKGKGVRRNYETAFKYFQQAAESNILPIAWGQVAEMYRRGRGVKKDRNLADELAVKYYNGETNRRTEYLIAKPKIIIPLPEEQLPTTVDVLELEKQYAGIKASAKKLMGNNDFTVAARVYKLAGYLQGYENSEELSQLIAEAEKQHSEKIARANSNVIKIIKFEENTPEVVEEINTDNNTNNNSESSELDRILNSIELASENVDDVVENSASEAEKLDIDSGRIEDKIETSGSLKESKFKRQYNTLIKEAERMLAAQNWEEAEQAFRLALALPESPDQGDAIAGLRTAITEKKKAFESGKVTISDTIAILSNATTLLRDKQWPQAIYLYDSILESDVGVIAVIGKEVAEKENIAETTPEELPEIGAGGDTRDVASYNMAVKQAKQFLANDNYVAAIQMLEIILNMDGYTDDAVATAMLETAKKMQLEHDNSPEALALKRQKNKPIFDKLIKSGEVYIAAGNYQGALDSFKLALKIPGYIEHKKTLEAIEHVENILAKPPVSPESKAEYEALMKQGRDALEQQNWVRAEETFRVILSLEDFEDDPDAMSGLKAAADAQNKPVPEVGSIDEELLQNGLIPADADLNEVRRRAEFEALVREGKRQMELMQYEVAEAMFNEALKIEGYTDNREAIKLLQEAIDLKPEQKEVTLPEHPEEEINPENDMKHQANLLLEEGNRLRAQQKLQEAIQAYTNGIDLDRANPRLRINRADTNAGLGNFDLALNDYNKVLTYAAADNEIKSYIWNNIANVYYYGKKDYASAVEFYTKAANAGNAASMNSLGVCYGFGKGVEKDSSLSLDWYTKAAENDYANAMLNLGLMYQNGWGIESDMSKALYWYEKAAERNIPRAYIRLSLMYQNGTGVEVDSVKAEEYKKMARELGYTADR